MALLVALALIGAAGAASSAEPVAAPAEAPTLLAHTKDMLVRLRVIHKATGARTAAGSGFVATPDGLVLTNYHLVSKIALEPHDHALELEHADGSRTTPRLVAIDVADDLAVLATGRSDQRFLPIRETWMTVGNRGFAMGYSRGLEPTIVEGTIHYDTGSAWPVRFTGAIDPGMSGGPAVSPDGEVLGVNVARRAGERLARKLVPSRSAAHLLRRAASVKEPPTDFRKEVAAQVSATLEFHYAFDLDATAAMGHYIVPDTRSSYARCSDARPWLRLPAFPQSTRTCQIGYDLFVDDDLQTGALLLTHERFEKGGLPTMEFAELMETVFAGGPTPSRRRANPGRSRRIAVTKTSSTAPEACCAWRSARAPTSSSRGCTTSACAP
ncbi:MAG: serine protease [Burkholderiales bacterium]|nr:serine protease [Burkholderiales bacterium]